MKARTLMTVLALAFAALATLTACGGQDAPPAAAPSEATAPAPAPAEPTESVEPATAAAGNVHGETTYKMYCSTCHGVEGKGDGVAAAALNPRPASFAAGAFKYDTNGNGTPGEIEDIKAIIRDGAARHGGSPLMAPWPMLSDEQLQAVAGYVKSLHVD